MRAQSVCAVIVTYHPSARMLESLPQVLAQVQGLVVIDNGSSVEELVPLRVKKQLLGFQLIENRENLGIAEALNQGVRWAHDQGYPWVILFDQDSGITDGFMSHMFSAWESHPERERVGSLHPRYVDPDTGIEAPVPRARDDSPVLPMTSGSLMPAWIFDKIGWFASEYFIDAVDWEYCFRIRAAGYLIADSRQARLLHSPGSPARATILGRTFHVSHHSAIRRYYISRNSIVLSRKYLFSFPGWILTILSRHLHETIVCLLAEENRARKLRNFMLGTWDGLSGRMGRREGL
jgi:rhamnosyltransferase